MILLAVVLLTLQSQALAAITLSASGQRLTISSITSPPLASANAGYLCLWFKSDTGTVDDDRMLAMLRNTGNSSAALRMVCGRQFLDSDANAGEAEIWMRDNTGHNANAGSEDTSDGSVCNTSVGWSFLELINDGTDYKVVINRNDTLAASVAVAGTLTFNELIIGGHNSVAGWTADGHFSRILWTTGVPTEAERNALYAGGIPAAAVFPRNQVPSVTVYAEWLLEDDLLDTSGNSRTLTATGSPTYDSTEQALLHDPKLVIRSGSGYEVVEVGSGDTSTDFAFRFDEPGYDLAVGMICPNASAQTYANAIVGSDRTQALMSKLDLAHPDGRTDFESGAIFWPGTISKSKVVQGQVDYASTGQVTHLVYRWTKGSVVTSKVPWSGPNVVRVGTVDHHFSRAIYQGSCVYWPEGGDPVRISTDASIQGGQYGTNDDKHLACNPVKFSTADGDSGDYIFALWCDGHSDQNVYGVKLNYSGDEITSVGSPVLLASGGDYTYGIARKSETADELYYFVRGDANDDEQPSLLRVQDCDATPSARLDVLWGHDPSYTAAMEKVTGSDDTLIYVCLGQTRDATKAKAGDLLLAVYRPDVDRWANAAGFESDVFVAGTAATPRFDSAATRSLISSNGCALLQEAAGTYAQQYIQQTMLVDASSWTTVSPTLKVIVPYITSDHTDERNYADAPPLWQDSMAPATMHLGLWNGSTFSDMAGVPEEITNGPSNAYRQDTLLMWQDDNAATNVSYGVFPIRGRGTSEKPFNQYSDWGADSHVVYKISDPFGTPVWTRLSQIDSSRERIGSIRKHPDVANTIVITEEVGAESWAWRHASKRGIDVGALGIETLTPRFIVGSNSFSAN